MLSQRNSLRLQRGRDRTAQLLEYQDRSRSISAFRAHTFGLQYSLRQGGGRKEGRKADNPFPSVITNAPGLMLSLYQSGKQNGCKKWTENHCCCSPRTPESQPVETVTLPIPWVMWLSHRWTAVIVMSFSQRRGQESGKYMKIIS